MSSFFAESIVFISNQRATVCAVLSSSRTLFNSSIIPVALNIDPLWDKMREVSTESANTEKRLLSVFEHADTFQFCPKLRFHFAHYEKGIFETIFPPLFDTTYFSRTLKSLTAPWFLSLDKVLERVVSLEKLELIGGHVRDAAKCLESLPTGSALRQLIIYDATAISDDIFKTVLTKKTPNLRHLHLVYLYVTDEENFASSLGSLECLEKLTLSYIRLTNHTMKSVFPDKLRRIRDVSLISCLDLTDDGVAMLAKLPNLEKLELSRPEISEKSIRALTDKTSSNLVNTLTSISFVHDSVSSRITSWSPCHLSSLSCLRNLHLSRAELCKALMKKLAKMHHLESLSFNLCSFNNGGSDALELLVTTASASSGDNDNDNDEKPAPPNLPNLKVLKVEFAASFSSKSIMALSKLPALESLTLTGCQLQDEVVYHLSKFPRLSNLILTYVGGVTAPVLVKALPLCKQLSGLYIARPADIQISELSSIKKALSGTMTTLISKKSFRIATPALFDENLM